MRYILETSKLILGDILLVRTNDRTCEKIRQYSKSNYSHALIYCGSRTCLESNALGVASVNPQRILFDNIDDLCLLRLKEIESLPLLETGLANASKKVGLGYSSRKELMKSYLNTLDKAEEGNRQFCTRFVAQIYAESGLALVQNEDYCSPRDIENSTLLKRILGCLKVASSTEIELAQEEDHVLNIQIEAIFSLLENIRRITNVDIQSIDQIDGFLLENQQYDKEFNEFLRESKYLELGDLEKEKNILMYNADTFIRNCGLEQCINVSLSQVQDEELRIINFIEAIKKYKHLYNQTNLEYFKSHYQCYERNLALSKERMLVWKTIINKFCI